MEHVQQFRELGYAVVKRVFDRGEIEELSAEAERLAARALGDDASLREASVERLIRPDARLGRVLRYVRWPARVSPILERYRLDRRLLDLVRPLIGDNLKQIINQLAWKQPGATDGSFAYHQDARFRRPAEAFRDLANSYVQTSITIDPHRVDNGCMRVHPRSHTLGRVDLPVDRSVMDQAFDDDSLRRLGLDPADTVDLVLEPGDVALWGAFLLHGSGPNRSAIDRRSYINGFVVARNCDVGEWALRHGKPCPLPAQIPAQDADRPSA